MALRPCSACGKRFPGPAESVYPAVVVGTDSERSKLKMCPRHFARYSDEVIAMMTEVNLDDDDQQFVHECFVHGVPGEHSTDLFPCFVTWYPRGIGRRDAYGEICAAHLREWGHNLLQPSYNGAGGH